LKRELDQTPLESAEAECLVDWLFNANRSQEDEDETEQDDSPIADPPPEGWTYGSIRQVMTELSEALSKSPVTTLSKADEGAHLFLEIEKLLTRQSVRSSS
jgi:hypothetical protein